MSISDENEGKRLTLTEDAFNTGNGYTCFHGNENSYLHFSSVVINSEKFDNLLTSQIDRLRLPENFSFSTKPKVLKVESGVQTLEETFTFGGVASEKGQLLALQLQYLCSHLLDTMYSISSNSEFEDSLQRLIFIKKDLENCLASHQADVIDRQTDFERKVQSIMENTQSPTKSDMTSLLDEARELGVLQRQSLLISDLQKIEAALENCMHTFMDKSLEKPAYEDDTLREVFRSACDCTCEVKKYKCISLKQEKKDMADHGVHTSEQSKPQYPKQVPSFREDRKCYRCLEGGLDSNLPERIHQMATQSAAMNDKNNEIQDGIEQDNRLYHDNGDKNGNLLQISGEQTDSPKSCNVSMDFKSNSVSCGLKQWRRNKDEKEAQKVDLQEHEQKNHPLSKNNRIKAPFLLVDHLEQEDQQQLIKCQAEPASQFRGGHFWRKTHSPNSNYAFDQKYIPRHFTNEQQKPFSINLGKDKESLNDSMNLYHRQTSSPNLVDGKYGARPCRQRESILHESEAPEMPNKNKSNLLVSDTHPEWKDSAKNRTQLVSYLSTKSKRSYLKGHQCPMKSIQIENSLSEYDGNSSKCTKEVENKFTDKMLKLDSMENLTVTETNISQKNIYILGSNSYQDIENEFAECLEAEKEKYIGPFQSKSDISLDCNRGQRLEDLILCKDCRSKEKKSKIASCLIKRISLGKSLVSVGILATLASVIGRYEQGQCMSFLPTLLEDLSKLADLVHLSQPPF